MLSLRLRIQEVVRYAVYLGMRPIQDKDLLWIAECALTAPVPGEDARRRNCGVVQ